MRQQVHMPVSMLLSGDACLARQASASIEPISCGGCGCSVVGMAALVVGVAALVVGVAPAGCCIQ